MIHKAFWDPCPPDCRKTRLSPLLMDNCNAQYLSRVSSSHLANSAPRIRPREKKRPGSLCTSIHPVNNTSPPPHCSHTLLNSTHLLNSTFLLNLTPRPFLRMYIFLCLFEGVSTVRSTKKSYDMMAFHLYATTNSKLLILAIAYQMAIVFTIYNLF